MGKKHALSPAVKKWAEGSIGRVSPILSTITVENGVGGHHFKVIGHEVEPSPSVPGLLYVLPLKVDGTTRDDDWYNIGPVGNGDAGNSGEKGTVFALNKDRIVMIVVESWLVSND
ncbi:hypothetical protein GoPhGRU1p56 [Gordonia phage GRU1]|uniref:Uncharacterized protein n=1 Tax=Gordonia phage GRU1 TaxID=1109710 RepID=G8EK15_9CAUD|nr:hypothetical protein GoPhGRU1p56 [Gordonia phage GRU1]AET09897.1 hypothetical protein [Gordonia phage GRU1]